MILQGAPQLHARLAAVRAAPKGIAGDWAKETARLARARVAVDTGRTKRSIRPSSGDMQGQVEVRGVGRFIEGGVRRHDITPSHSKVLRFSQGGRPVYAKRVHHPGNRARPFLAPSARQAYRTVSPAKRVVDAWNGAA